MCATHVTLSLRVYCSHACTTLKSNHFNELSRINLCFLCVIVPSLPPPPPLPLLPSPISSFLLFWFRYQKEKPINFFLLFVYAYSWIISLFVYSECKTMVSVRLLFVVCRSFFGVQQQQNSLLFLFSLENSCFWDGNYASSALEMLFPFEKCAHFYCNRWTSHCNFEKI